MPQLTSPVDGSDILRSTLNRIADIPEGEWAAILPLLSNRTFERQAYLAQAGENLPDFYFLLSGLVRFFYSTRDGKEFNKHFSTEGGFAGSFHSLVLGEPPAFFIQALEPTRVIVLPNRVLTGFYDRHPCWERLGRRLAEHLLLVKEAREKELLLDSLETRYLRFIRDFPALVDRIPQYHIASYLGVTDVALSRLRKRLKH